MLLQNKQIAIVGGGPGGLTLARLLQLKDANVKVYERDINKDVRVQGSPLDMHEESGYAALRKANLLNEFTRNVRTGADKKIVVNERAEIMLSDHETNSTDDSDKKPSPPEIDRSALRKVLLESLHPETVVWNSHFISLEKQNEGWLLHFKNGSSAYADIVVAADGANSKIRPYITGIKAFYSGIIMLEINITNAKETTPHIYALLNGGKVMAFGNGKNILGGQKGDGGLGFYATFKADENWATNNGLDYAIRKYFRKDVRDFILELLARDNDKLPFKNYKLFFQDCKTLEEVESKYNEEHPKIFIWVFEESDGNRFQAIRKKISDLKEFTI